MNKPKPPILRITKNGRATLVIDVNDLSSLIQDAAKADGQDKLHCNKEKYMELALQVADWWRKWEPDSGTVMIACDVAEYYGETLSYQED